MRHRAAWAALVCAAAAGETAALNRRNGETFSEFTRWLFRVDTAAGRIAFVIGWTALYAWFCRHIISGRHG